jgi:hypothetical protein
MALVRAAYAEYHPPAPSASPAPAPAEAAAATIDADEMSRHAVESFEEFRKAETPSGPAIISGVNPFPSSPPPAPAAQVAEPASAGASAEPGAPADAAAPREPSTPAAATRPAANGTAAPSTDA